ncbi:cell division site-positioning protein MapZ family protein [Streptococcus sp. NLN64]|uniref:cell division site-positioning protein MapZ family protein n=1 Tax=Streptococcus sp. NLN64 TaxID=2822799 RepID=UPI0018CB0B14|nr:cell division site-positioning protein MapZ family protein [Streptococcus sp. NLN64]MBG9367235.1 Holliday junction resolvase [Streptococcus sp. NLN64]
MSKQDGIPPQSEHDGILDLEQAQDLTVAEAVRKNEESKAGIVAGDNALDKYIKQHKDEIQQAKFDTQTIDLSEATRRVSENLSSETSIQVASTFNSEAISEVADKVDDLGQTTVFDSIPVESVASSTGPEEETSEVDVTFAASPAAVSSVHSTVSATEEFAAEGARHVANLPFYKKKSFVYSAAAALAILVLGGTSYALLQQSQQSYQQTTSSSSSSRSSSSSSSQDEKTVEENLKAFNDLLDTFYTSSEKTALKNAAFGDLPKLQEALNKLRNTKEYDKAKETYDKLSKEISAIQDLNAQFESPVLVDGEIQADARPKANASFGDIDSGNESLNALIKQGLEKGRQEAVAAPAPQTANAASNAGSATTEAQAQTPAPTETAPVAPVQATAPVNPAPATTTISPGGQAYPAMVVTPEAATAVVPAGGGYINWGIPIQRQLSRVTYDPAKLVDSENQAWFFTPGVLERILDDARRNGYIVGNQYILERVNIINGNAYFNLFKPDGTYLFSINAKTGYYVGNAPGGADALDY